jgi:hypothetical protein
VEKIEANSSQVRGVSEETDYDKSKANVARIAFAVRSVTSPNNTESAHKNGEHKNGKPK